MARVLIVGCGCRGRALGAALRSEGHAVRGTTRDPAKAAEIEAAGIEAWVGDPLRLSTLTRALASVTVVCWLMAGARGPADELEALHGVRLRAYLREMVDTTVRGFVYEATGRVDSDLLASGSEVVTEMGGTWELPCSLLEADPRDADSWTRAARLAVAGLLGTVH